MRNRMALHTNALSQAPTAREEVAPGAAPPEHRNRQRCPQLCELPPLKANLALEQATPHTTPRTRWRSAQAMHEHRPRNACKQLCQGCARRHGFAKTCLKRTSALHQRPLCLPESQVCARVPRLLPPLSGMPGVDAAWPRAGWTASPSAEEPNPSFSSGKRRLLPAAWLLGLAAPHPAWPATACAPV